MRIASEEFAEIGLQRKRVTVARSLLKEARSQAQSAKVRRKLAKLLARRAIEAAKQAKVNLAEAQNDLARAEALVGSNGDNGHAAKRKTAKSKTPPRGISKLSPKQPVAPAKRKTASPVAAIAALMSMPEALSSPISDPAA